MNRRGWLRLVTIAVLAGCVPAHALDITVTTEADSGAGSLRDAITQAIGAGEDTFITFAETVDEIEVDTALPTLTTTTHLVRIDGKQSVILSGENLSDDEPGFHITGSNIEIRGMIIVDFPTHGILILGGSMVSVAGCWLGTDGQIARPNISSGIAIANATDIVVGGDTAGDRNVISGNGQFGIATGQTLSLVRIQGNYIGTDVTGALALGNGNSGISAMVSNGDIQVGGTEPGAGNVISGNGIYGINISSSDTQFTIQGNLIGLNSAGTGAVANLSAGILVSASESTTIGGAAAGARNVVSGNALSGMLIGGASDVDVQGNWIGLSATGDAAIANGDGIIIASSEDVLIGGLDAGEGNAIAGNTNAGIDIDGNSSSITVQGNQIGIDAAMMPLGNGGPGIESNSSAGVLVGGTTETAANTIAYNEVGIALTDSVTAFGIRRNSIFANTDGGILLSGDANDGIPPPTITMLGSVTGTSVPNGIVEIFADNGGQGEIFLDIVQADALGDFFSPVNLFPYEGMNVTATVTGVQANTSAFSAPVLVEDVALEFHIADQDQSGTISLSELLRVIQFFNSTGISCVVPPVTSEDGYLPVPGFKGCGPHSSDYNPADWEIGLSELLRLIQFFNSSGYEVCIEGEDGFCPLA